MDISSLKIIPTLSGNSASGVSGSTSNAGPVEIKPEVIVQKVAYTDGNSAKTGSEGNAKVVSSEPLTNAYVVNDQRFTIFKDSLGYVTKYTSLVDGRVTYIPDQDLARF